MFKISIKREYTTNCEVDAIPQIVHCLQTVEINPHFGLYCVENIFKSFIYRPVGSTKHIPVSSVQNPIHHHGISVCAEIVHCENERPARMILIQIVKNMINETIDSFNCRASLHLLFVPMHLANIIAAHCKKCSPSPHVHIHHSDCSAWTKLSYQTFNLNAPKRTQLHQC